MDIVIKVNLCVLPASPGAQPSHHLLVCLVLQACREVLPGRQEDTSHARGILKLSVIIMPAFISCAPAFLSGITGKEQRSSSHHPYRPDFSPGMQSPVLHSGPPLLWDPLLTDCTPKKHLPSPPFCSCLKKSTHA